MKKKFTVALGVSAVLLANPLSFSYAKNELVEGRALSMAHQYIENSLSDKAWAGNNPVISAQNKFYTDDAKKVSYIEYKVSCDSTLDCGFIMMNVDGNDVSVPIASPSGNTPSEILDQGKDISEKLYYFGPFDLYSENEVTGDVQALDPQVAVDLRDDTQVKRSSEEAKLVKDQREELKTRLKDTKIAAKEFKKSDAFKKQKEEIKDQILNIPKEEFSMKMLELGYAANYSLPGISDKFVPGGVLSGSCVGKTPCYNQFTTTYGTISCQVGCSPLAMAIIYGYHDRNSFPNLISGTAPATNTSTIQTIIKNIGVMMKTSCSGTTGITISTNMLLGIQYAKNMGYLNAVAVLNSSLSAGGVYNIAKLEVDAGRPLMLNVNNPTNNSDGHTTVIFGYKNTGTLKIVRMNMGWGGSDTFVNSSGTTFYTSNIDQDLNAIYYLGSSNHYPHSVVTVKIN